MEQLSCAVLITGNAHTDRQDDAWTGGAILLVRSFVRSFTLTLVYVVLYLVPIDSISQPLKSGPAIR